MAENTAFRNNALPYPVYGVPWVQVVPILDADGDPVTGATALDSEISLNGDTIADAGTEAEVGGGLYSIALSAANMTADVVAGVLKSAEGKTTCFVLNPRKLVSLLSGTAAGGAAGSITLDSGASAVDDTYNGCLVVAVLDGTTEARIITDYTGSSKVAAVTPNWNTTPDSDDTFTVYLPEGMQIPQANVKQWNGTAVPSEHTAGYPIVTVKDGTGTGEINTNAGAIVSVETLTTYTGNTPQTGDAYAIVNSGTHGNAALKTLIDAVDDFIDTEISVLITGVADLPTNAELATALAAADDAVLAAIADVQADTNDIQTRIPAALTGDGNMKADVLRIDGSATAATNQKNAATVVYTGTVTGATPTTTTLVDTGLTQTDADHFNGRVMIFLTGALKYQATDITSFNPTSDTLTFTALTSAPAQSDTYVIV